MSSASQAPPRVGRSSPGLAGRGLLLALALGALAGCKAPPLAEEQEIPEAMPAAPDVRLRLAFDDVVRVEVFEHPELSSGELGRRIDYEGNLDLPLLGPTPLVGLTVSEARETLEARAASFVKHANVAVTVVSYAPRLFYVMGEVKAAGSFELRRPVNALQSLALAGGMTDLADREEVVVLRTVAGRLTVKRFNAATPDAESLFPLSPGDVVFVRESGAGTFRQQILPYLQGLAQPFSATVSLFLVASRND